MKYRYVVKIAIENDAFAEDEAGEVVRILRELADWVEREGEVRPKGLFDVNGNLVGSTVWEGSKR